MIILLFVLTIFLIFIGICLYDCKIFFYKDFQLNQIINKTNGFKYVNGKISYYEDVFEKLKKFFNFNSYFLNNKFLSLNTTNSINFYTARFLESKNIFFYSCLSRLSSPESNFSGFTCIFETDRFLKDITIAAYTNDEDFINSNNQFNHNLLKNDLSKKYNKDGIILIDNNNLFQHNNFYREFLDIFNEFSNVLIYIIFLENKVIIFYSDAYTYNAKCINSNFSSLMKNIYQIINFININLD